MRDRKKINQEFQIKNNEKKVRGTNNKESAYEETKPSPTTERHKSPELQRPKYRHRRIAWLNHPSISQQLNHRCSAQSQIIHLLSVETPRRYCSSETEHHQIWPLNPSCQHRTTHQPAKNLNHRGKQLTITESAPSRSFPAHASTPVVSHR